MISLGLNERGDIRPLNRAQLEHQRARAVKARRLLDYEDFRWWRKEVDVGLQKLRTKLENHNLDDRQTQVIRGKIRGIAQILRELEVIADGLEHVEAQLARLELRK